MASLHKKYDRVFHWVLTLALVTSSLALVSCGFKLRGDVELHEQLKSLMLQGTPEQSELTRAVRTRLQNHGGELVSDVAVATSVLVISEDGSSRRVISVDSAGQATAYELTYRLGFHLYDPKGNSKVATQVIRSQRQFSFNPDNVLAKSDEENRIVEQMRLNAVDQMLRRLQTRLDQAANDPAVSAGGSQQPAPVSP